MFLKLLFGFFIFFFILLLIPINKKACGECFTINHTENNNNKQRIFI